MADDKIAPYYILQYTFDNLAEALSNEQYSAEALKLKRNVGYFNNYLGSEEIKARMIIVENEYVDDDYLDDFSNYYVKCFYPYKQRCKRLHFFSILWSDDEFKTIRIGDAPKEKVEQFKKSYIGFIVARPLPQTVIGRTALIPYPETKENGRHYPCTKKCHVNLFGIEINFQSLEFQEQDKAVSACATVAVWSCMHKTSEIFQTLVPSPAMITRNANEVVFESRAMPSSGLIVQQINKSIISCNLVSEIFRIRASTPLLPLLYSYLHAGLPIILGVMVEGAGRHAIALAGYNLGDDQLSATKKEYEYGIPFKADRIRELYAHDDQIVPFSRMIVEMPKTDDEMINFYGTWVDEEKKEYRTITPDVVIIPISQNIRITFLDVQKWIMDDFNSLVIADEELYGHLPAGRTEWDLFLTTVQKVKEDEIENLHYEHEELEKFLLFSHTRYIWHAILRKDNKRILELFADATDIPRPLPFYYIIWKEKGLKEIVIAAMDRLKEEKILDAVIRRDFSDFLRDGHHLPIT